MAEIVTHDTQTAEPGEFAAYLQAKTPAKASAAPVAPQPAVETAPEPGQHAAQTAPDAPAEPWEDPETGEPVEKPTRGDKRIKRLWAEKQEAKTRADRLEQELADLRAQTASGASAAPPNAEKAAATTDADALTMAAQARIRAKPDRGAIRTTYATYEDYVEDCAIWGGELAAEKRAVRAEASQAAVADQRRQTTFAESVTAARADYDDFEEVTTRDLPTNQAIFDATVNAPADVAGHVLYWLGAHPEETRRIAALAPGPALVAMGEVLATVKADRAAKAAPTVTSETKPKSRAPAPLQPVPRNGGAPTRPDQIAEAGGNPMDFIRLRNEQTRRRV